LHAIGSVLPATASFPARRAPPTTDPRANVPQETRRVFRVAQGPASIRRWFPSAKSFLPSQAVLAATGPRTYAARHLRHRNVSVTRRLFPAVTGSRVPAAGVRSVSLCAIGPVHRRGGCINWQRTDKIRHLDPAGEKSHNLGREMPNKTESA